MNFLLKLNHKWSAPYLIFIVLIAFQSLSVGVIMLKQHGMGEEILLVHAKDMMRRLADGAIYNASHHLKSAENVVQITKGLVDSDILSLEDTTSFEMYLLEILRDYGQFSGLLYGDKQGAFLYVSKQLSKGKLAYLTKIISFKKGEKYEELIKRDVDFSVKSRMQIRDDFDPRVRPWFEAFKQRKLLWTAPYIFYTSQDPGITVSIPIRGADNHLAGAFGVDIEISSLSDFLAQYKISSNSSAFIVSSDGEMVAHSNVDIIRKLDESGHAQLVNIINLKNDPVLTNLWSLIKGIDSTTLLQGTDIDFFVGDKKYLAVVRSFPENSNCPWTITVVAPENDFIGVFRKARRRHLLLALVYSIGITLIIFLLAGRFLKPVRRLLHYAHFDPMTDLYNRRAFFENSKKLVAEAQEKSTPICLAMIDVDDFKIINDTYGHGVGDEMLIAIAGRLQGALDAKDIIGRYGGEEFVLLLADAEPEQGMRVCERLRKSIANSPIHTASGLLKSTVSIGVSPLSISNPDLQEAINRADHALLQAKASGKNCTKLVA